MFVSVLFLAITLFEDPRVVSSGDSASWSVTAVEWTVPGPAHSSEALGWVGPGTGRPRRCSGSAMPVSSDRADFSFC